MFEYCFICAKLMTESETITVERGLKTLINASIERADDFSEYLKEQKSVTIHVSCRQSQNQNQFTLNELRNVSKITTVDYKTIKMRLKVKYGEKLIITEKSGSLTFICLTDNHHDILNLKANPKKSKKNNYDDQISKDLSTDAADAEASNRNLQRNIVDDDDEGACFSCLYSRNFEKFRIICKCRVKWIF